MVMADPGGQRPDTSLLVPMERKHVEADEIAARHREAAERARAMSAAPRGPGLIARIRRLLGR